MLMPEIDFSDAENTLETDFDEGNYTFKLDYATGNISRELVTGAKAVEQFVLLALRAPRFEHAIYSDQFGSEILDLIKDQKEFTLAYLESELERLVIEAIIYDDRVADVTNFEITFTENNAHIKFTVETIDEFIEIEEVLDINV